LQVQFLLGAQQVVEIPSEFVKIPRPQAFVQPALKAARDWTSKSYSSEPIVTLNKHCSMCQFRTDCEAKATETDDLSLLHRMTPKLMRRYQRKGIFTVNQLSYVFRPRKNRKNPRRATSQFNVELQALAMRTRKIYLHETPKIPRSPVELFLDIEGVPDRKFHYLIGILVVDQQDSRQHSFWADGPALSRWKIVNNYHCLHDVARMARRSAHVATAARNRQTCSAGQKTAVFDCGIQGTAMPREAGSANSMA
jgi:hypothetical protein